ncbi:MAG: Hsp20 family protein [Proteobacteria bacterium]|nr:Hsp20 family protein [Pseudomonadota bacterium]
MQAFDLSPLFRSTVGFDRFNRLFDAAFNSDEGISSYPPYDIEKLGEHRYRVTMAIAGFSEDELQVTSQENLLTVAGKKPDGAEKSGGYLYHGIAARSFERRFQLADHVKTTGAELRNGLLTIDLTVEVPEAMRPRRIEIQSSGGEAKAIKSEAA